MTEITFVAANGSAQTFDAADGKSVMEIALANNLIGINAECGGAMACATCKVWFSPDWIARLPEASDVEISLLEGEPADRRLSCQIKITPALDGLVVNVPASQY